VQVLELADQDVDVSSFVGEGMSMQLYEQHITEQLSNGVGAIDTERLLQGIPEQLQIDAKKARSRAEYLAKNKVRPTLVQALAYQRTKDNHAAVKYMRNLMACARVDAGAAKGVKWDSKKELLDLYGLFCSSSKDDSERGELGGVLRLSAEEQSDMRAAVDSGAYEEGGGGMARAGGSGREPESFF
jgi:hypothetical protein